MVLTRLALKIIVNRLGDIMELFAALNLEPIFQLTFVALIMLAGPFVIFLLAFRGGRPIKTASPIVIRTFLTSLLFRERFFV
jgi:hypothetical protein